jgi:predicted transporter
VPAFAVGAAVTFIVLSAVTAVQPPGISVVNLKVIVPVKFAAGVYVTIAGDAVCAVLLKVPPPEIMDQAPVIAPPLTEAPLNVIAEGEAD